MTAVTQPLKDLLKSAAEPRFTAQLRRSLPGVAAGLQRLGLYCPYDPGASAYSRPAEGILGAGLPLPVPPRGLWADYCTSAESYLASGREDCETMRRILGADGTCIQDAGRILDLGCAGGRMIRHLADVAGQAQVWGCDIWAEAITWCQANLAPPFWFATTTVVPHLPFEDRSFGLVYCGSLFTHIDDLAEAWFLELHRILRPGGWLYFSVNDRHAIEVFDGKADSAAYAQYHERTGGRDIWDAFVAACSVDPDYQRFRHGEAWMAALGRNGNMAHVMWDADVLARHLGYGYRLRSVNPESYGHQTTVLLERI
jgi:SAM-dependent methyltransferase